MALNDEYLFLSDDLPKRCFSFFGRKRTEFCDITFKVGELSIKAHRIILAAAIPYFYQLFSDQEMADSEKKEIDFPDIDSNALEALVEYAYNCKVKISMENVKMLLSGACMLEVDEVRDACCQFLAERLNSENVLDIRYFSLSLGCSGLVKEVDIFIEKNFSQIMVTENFLNISFSLLNNFISRDELNVQSEEVVFESALKWVKKDPKIRHEKLPELLKNIRLPLLNPSYIKNHAAKEELIRSSSSCRDLVEEAIFYIFFPEERKETCGFCIKPRRNDTCDQKTDAKENLNICILHDSCVVECFDLVKEKWENRMIHGVPSNISLSESGVAMENKMYCFDKDVTHVLDLETNRYSSCKGMRYPRRYTVPVAYKERVYVCGGWRNRHDSNIVECFDPKTEEWTQLAPMNVSRSSMGAAAYKEFIYVLGGSVEIYAVTDCVEMYSVETGKWSISSPMLTGRNSFGCCTLSDKIYVYGGRSIKNKYLSTAEVFDPITNKWKSIAPMNTHRWLCKSVSCCNKIYVLGGYNKNTYLSTVEIYDPEKDEWKHSERTNEKTSIVGAAIVLLKSV